MLISAGFTAGQRSGGEVQNAGGIGSGVDQARLGVAEFHGCHHFHGPRDLLGLADTANAELDVAKIHGVVYAFGAPGSAINCVLNA